MQWYKHSPEMFASMTEALSDGAYRAFHVIFDIIMTRKGPIRWHRALAGRCNQSRRAFEKNMTELQEAGLITLTDGYLSNAYALKLIEEFSSKSESKRETGRMAGLVSGTVRRERAASTPMERASKEKRSSKPLNFQGPSPSAVPDRLTRREEIRGDTEEKTAIRQGRSPSSAETYNELF